MLLVDSYGICALALDRRSAAAPLKLRAGSTVVLVPQGAGPASEVGPVRWGTSLVLVVLLALILIAAIIQFVFRLGPS